MPAGRAAKRGAPAVRPPSARRAALTRPTEPDLPAPPVRRRRIASAAAGRPDDLPPTDAASTASMVAIVTREVLKQLREDRVASLPPPSLPAPEMPVAAPLDLAVTGALSSLVDSNMYPGEPTPAGVPMHTTPLGADLSDKLKGKIWANEFIDFLDLTHPVQQQPHQISVQSGESHQLVSIMPQTRVRQISSIDQWTSAFLVFGAVYTEDRVASLPPPSLPAPEMPVAAPLDLAVTGALSSLVDSNMYPGEPTPAGVPMHTTPLGADLSDKLKGKIWANEFIDFLDLTHPVQQQPHQISVQSGESHQLVSIMPQTRVRQISSIDQWTSDFLVFGAVYTQRFPHSPPGLFKYAEIVRDIALTGPPFAWRLYDCQFRTLRQSDPVNFPWEQPRWDLFFRCMYAKPFQGGYSRAPSTVFHQPAPRSQPFPIGCCWLYQKGGKCNTRNCRFKHVCSKCQAPTQLAHVASNPLILRLLNAALTEGTRQAYKHAVTAFSIPVLRMSQR